MGKKPNNRLKPIRLLSQFLLLDCKARTRANAAHGLSKR